MYIYAKSRTLKSGENVVYHSLVESYRVHGNPRQRTLLNLGRNFKIPKEQWRTLTQLILDDLRGSARLPLEDPTLLQASKDIIRKLNNKGYDVHAPRDDRDPVIANEMHHTDTRTVGGERIVLNALHQIKFSSILRTVSFTREQICWAIALVAGRMLSPGSERQTHEWMRERSSILELLCGRLPCERTLYRIARKLYENREAIMDALYHHTQKELEFTETIAFFDLTNVYYTGRKKGKLLRYGRSKEKRKNCPLVSISMTIDASGFPRTAEILPGNVSEPKTLRSAIRDLKLNGEHPTVIMDAGITTKENIAYLKDRGLNWIGVQRTKTPPVPTRKPDQIFQTSSQMKVRAWKLPNENGERRVYLHSEARQAVSNQIITRKREEFEAAIAYVNAGIAIPGRPKNYDVILRKVGRLIEENKKVAHHYEIQVVRSSKNENLAEKIVLTRRSAYDECTEAFGGYVLRTSHTEWSCEDIARTYWRLGEIERAFRTMKSDLGLRPLYHNKDEQIAAHLFLSILAFHVVHFIRTKLGRKQVTESWGTLKVRLNEHTRVTTVLPENESHCLLFHQDRDLKPFQRKLFQIMGIPLDNHTLRRKVKRPKKETPEM